MKARGLLCRPRYPDISAGQKEEIVLRYRAGESATLLAKEFGVADVSVLRWLEARGVVRRTNSAAQTKYTCRHDRFREIDTPDKAYWLGFLAADGCVKRNGDLSVHLAERDRPHLEALAKFLGSNRPIPTATHNGHPMACMVVRSPQICRDLTGHGVTPAKTFTLRWPSLSEALVSHYARGYVDGDGCFSWNQKKHYAPTVFFSVTGNLGFMENLQQVLIESCGLNRIRLLPSRKSDQIVSSCYGGNRQVARIARYLYRGAAVLLDRKRDKVSCFLEV